MQTFNLTPEQLERVKALLPRAKGGTTLNEMVSRLIDAGLYQLEYRLGEDARKARKAYQEKRRETDKTARALLERAQSDPELAVKLGLGTRPEL
jgi:hypothetical protein